MRSIVLIIEQIWKALPIIRTMRTLARAHCMTHRIISSNRALNQTCGRLHLKWTLLSRTHVHNELSLSIHRAAHFCTTKKSLNPLPKKSTHSGPSNPLIRGKAP
jgi:hypothetical protein